MINALTAHNYHHKIRSNFDTTGQNLDNKTHDEGIKMSNLNGSEERREGKKGKKREWRKSRKKKEKNKKNLKKKE